MRQRRGLWLVDGGWLGFAFLCVLCVSAASPGFCQETPSAEATAAPGAGDYLSYGQTLLSQGRAGESKPYFEYALNLDPSLWQAWLGLGHGAQQEKRWDDALAAFENVLKLNPAEPQALKLAQDMRRVKTPYAFSDEVAEVMARAKKQGVPMLLLFSGDKGRCPPCGAYLKRLIEMEDMRPLLHGYAGVLVDAVWSEGKASIYDVSKLPTLLALTPTGKLMGRLDGDQPQEKVAEFLRGLPTRK